ncbi:MAG: flagellar motor switch protein FliN [Spirochaetes bacterium]|nr:flagellar motor switch protein FliN [Spirochaetota bacterium]
MSDGALSQDEIEALLKGADDAISLGSGPVVSSGGGNGGGLSESQRATFFDIAKVIAEHQAFSLSSISTKNTTIGDLAVKMMSASELKSQMKGAVLEAKVAYSGPVNGTVYYYIPSKEAAQIASIMMGQDDSELNEMALQALTEAYSQMIGASDTAVSNKYGGSLSAMPAELKAQSGAITPSSGDYAVVTGKLSIEGVADGSPYFMAFETGLAKSLVNMVTGGGRGQSAPKADIDDATDLDSLLGGGSSSVNVKPVEFGALSPAATVQPSGNIGLLMDVTMNLTVELGRATMPIRDILGLGEGSIIELQKLAGEPVDLLVNGKLIAKGEVVVIDENFGVRVTDIINPSDRISGNK